jgi:hypothetical protein
MRALAFVVLAACGAQPNQPVLANAPRPNPVAVAGGAAAAAAAITLADPDAASRRPEKKQNTEKKPVKVKENVPAAVLDRLDKAEAQGPASDDSRKQEQPATAPKQPRDALDFSGP